MNNRQRFMFLFIPLASALLLFAGAALAQTPTDEPDPTQEPTPEVVPDDTSITVEDGGVVIQQAPQTETAPTEITVEPAESKLDIATLLGVFSAGAIALAAGLAIWTRTGGDVAATITEFSESQEFDGIALALAAAIPAEVHQRALDTIDSLNERLKDALAVGGAIAAAVDKITDKPAPPAQ